jgi:hypothetical protein
MYSMHPNSISASFCLQKRVCSSAVETMTPLMRAKSAALTLKRGFFTQPPYNPRSRPRIKSRSVCCESVNGIGRARWRNRGMHSSTTSLREELADVSRLSTVCNTAPRSGIVLWCGASARGICSHFSGTMCFPPPCACAAMDGKSRYVLICLSATSAETAPVRANEWSCSTSAFRRGHPGMNPSSCFPPLSFVCFPPSSRDGGTICRDPPACSL